MRPASKENPEANRAKKVCEFTRGFQINNYVFQSGISDGSITQLNSSLGQMIFTQLLSQFIFKNTVAQSTTAEVKTKSADY